MKKIILAIALVVAACEQEPDLVCYYGPGYTECYYDDYYQLSEDELFEELGLVEEELAWVDPSSENFESLETREKILTGLLSQSDSLPSTGR